MCGIGGIVYWDGRPAGTEAVAGLLHAQRHRGPDETGAWAGRGAVLGHNRLSIIDLATGQQPMRTEDGRYVIVYNGELYNYPELKHELESAGQRFQTRSDTEAVLKAFAQWGSKCLGRLRGMYALAIWDDRERQLFLARDRLGIKPLYYCATATSCAFASELQGLVALAGIPRRLDLVALDLYLHYQYVPAPFAIYADVRKLPPAHSLLLEAKRPGAEPRAYWDVAFRPDFARNLGDWLDALDGEIRDSVARHLVSDVPFGAFLSGGIDSSTVVHHMSRILKEPVKTFTIGFEESAYDEREHAFRVAGLTGSERHFEVVRADGIELLGSLLPSLARHYGEPFADSSAVPTWYVSRLARTQVKMVLSGDGGDELFAGYNSYPAILAGLGTPPRAGFLRRWFGGAPGEGSAVGFAQGPPRSEALPLHSRSYAYFDDETRPRLYRRELAEKLAGRQPPDLFGAHFRRSEATECLSALQYLDIKTYLCGDILTKVDVASMCHALEVRVPLLDHRVVELAARVPARYKLVSSNGQVHKKFLLKEYARRLLPGADFDRPKQGFGVPIATWFGGVLYPEVRDRLVRPEGLLHRLFDPRAREELVASPAAATNHAPRIWALLCLEAWAGQFQATGLDLA